MTCEVMASVHARHQTGRIVNTLQESPMRFVRPSPLLSLAIKVDALASAALGVLQVGASAWLAQTLHLPQALLFESGLFLLGYAALLFVVSRRPAVPAALVLLVIVGNFGWALASIVLGAGLAPVALGLAYLWAQAAAVLAFAALQWAGLRASAPLRGVEGGARA
jgi:hypothetical protein